MAVIFMSFPQMYALAYGIHQNYLKNNILTNTTMQGSSTLVFGGSKLTQTPTIGKTNLQTVFTPGIAYGEAGVYQVMKYRAQNGSDPAIGTIDGLSLVSSTQNTYSLIAGASVADKYLDRFTGCNFVAPATINILALQWNLHVTGLGLLKKLK